MKEEKIDVIALQEMHTINYLLSVYKKKMLFYFVENARNTMYLQN